MPAWRPLDAAPSARLLSALPGEGGVVALCVSSTLAGTPEGAVLAVELARGWAAAGHRVLLADGTVGTPSLHVPLGLANGRGLADVLLAGGAWEPLAVPTDTPGLRLLPAGGSAASTAPQDALAQLAGLCRGAAAEGTLLVLFVPLGSMVTEWVFRECMDVVVLASEGDTLAPFFDRDEDRIRAILGPSPEREVAQGSLPLGTPGEAQPPQGPQGLKGMPDVDPQPRDAVPDRPVEAAPHRTPEPRPKPEPKPEREPQPKPKPSPKSKPEPEAGPTLEPKIEPTPDPDPVPDRADVRESAPSPRPERRFRSPPPEAPSTERIEDAWAKAAAELRARGRARSRLDAAGRPDADDSPPTRPAAESKPSVPRAPIEPREPPADASPPKPPARPTPPTFAPKPSASTEEPVEAGLPRPIPSAPPWDALEVEPYEGLPRTSGWRVRLRRGLGFAVVVVVVAGAVWIWHAAGDMPPLEPPVTTLPRATIRPEAPAEDRRAADDPEASGEPAGADPRESEGPSEAAATPAAAPDVEAAPPPAQRISGVSAPPHQRFSWSLAALGSFEAARALAERLGRAAPDHAFTVAPIVSNGRTLYRVLGGLAEDRDGLLAARGALARRTGMNSGDWLVREAPYALLIRDFDDRAAAAARARDLWGAGIPSYVLVAEREDGSLGHRLYAGAYGTEQEAAPLRALLEGAGVTGVTFTERRGRWIR